MAVVDLDVRMWCSSFNIGASECGDWCVVRTPVEHGCKWVESELEAALRELGGKRAPAPGEGWGLKEAQLAPV